MIEELYTYIINEFQTNDVFSGVVGGSLAASVFYQLRNFPKFAFNHSKPVFTSSVDLISTDYRFKDFLRFFQEQKSILRKSKFSLLPHTQTIGNDYVEVGERFKPNLIGIGYGKHAFLINGKICIVDYFNDSKDSIKIVERIKITILSRKPEDVISYILKSIENIKGDNELTLMINTGRHWSKVDGILKRGMESVFVEKGIKESIINQIDRFLTNKEFCLDKGIQWKKSFLFDGPAGTGKSSLCMAIASKYNMRVYFLSLSSVESDDDLQKLFSQIPKESIILIEDVDCAKRESKSKDNNNKGITTSGLLNVLDGALTPTGRLLLMTTNHYDKLDPALVRAGRVDHRFTIDKMSLETARDMVNYLRPDLEISDKDIIGKTGAELEVILK